MSVKRVLPTVLVALAFGLGSAILGGAERPGGAPAAPPAGHAAPGR